MNKNNLIGIVVIVVVIAVGAYFIGENSNVSKQSTATPITNSGSTSQTETTQTPQQTQVNNVKSASGMSADEIFAEKTKCEGYMQGLQQKAGENGSALEIDAIYKVFYSQSLNTCLVEQYNLYPAHGTVAEGEVLLINDVLTGGNVWTSQVYTPELKYWDAQSILDQQAVQYQ
jgi:hypothetical protein